MIFRWRARAYGTPGHVLASRYTAPPETPDQIHRLRLSKLAGALRDAARPSAPDQPACGPGRPRTAPRRQLEQRVWTPGQAPFTSWRHADTTARVLDVRCLVRQALLRDLWTMVTGSQKTQDAQVISFRFLRVLSARNMIEGRSF